MKAFRSRLLDGVYPVLWVDALYEKNRVNNRVQNLVVLIVIGITLVGAREVFAVEPIYQKSQATDQALFRDLKARGLQEVWLYVSNA